MSWVERIVTDPKVQSGKPVIRGTRITVEFVMSLYAGGWAESRILEEYDHLTPEDLRACHAYAADSLKDERVFGLAPAA